MPHKIHDKGYKRLFSNKRFFQQLMESFVAQDWVAEIDFSECETVDKSFISEHYKETESDLIYKVKYQGKESYICILIEFQSTVQWHTALRVLSKYPPAKLEALICEPLKAVTGDANAPNKIRTA